MQCTINFVDNPLHFYKSGEQLDISVELYVNEEYNVDEIYLQITGQASCQFLAKRNQKLLTGFSNILGHKITLQTQSTLESGFHQFDANFQLPSDLPTSMLCQNRYWKKAGASISYKAVLYIESSWKPNLKFENSFTVVSPLNLNDFSPVLQIPLRREIFKNFSFDFSSKELYMSAAIPQRGFIAGDEIAVNVNVHNLTRTRITCVRMSLNKNILLTSQKPIIETIRIEIAESIEYSSGIKPKSHKVFTKFLRVPTLEPNIDSHLIKVSYEILVKAKADGLHRSATLRLPVLIGTTRLSEEGRIYRYSNFETDI